MDSDDSANLSDSDLVAEAGSSASASVADAKLASLRELEPQNPQLLVNEENWHDPRRPDFHRRQVAEHYYFPSSGDITPRSGISPRSDTSSMAVSIQSRTLSDTARSVYVASPHTPSLVSTSTFNTRSTFSSQLAESNFLEYVLPEDGVDASPEVSASEQGRLPCCFRFLACSSTFNDIDEWDTHCQSHFHGHLPLNVQCPFECDWRLTRNSGQDAWQARKSHIRNVHQGAGIVDTARRPEKELLQHLWRNGVIDNAQLKELREHGYLSGEQVFMRSAGAVPDNRRTRRQGTTGTMGRRPR